MRVGFNANILITSTLRGWSRYTIHLIQGAVESGNEVFLFSSHEPNLDLLPIARNRYMSIVQSGRNYVDWEQRVLKNLGEHHRIDILHCPINYGLPYLGRFKKVLTLHDAIEKSFYDSEKSLVGRLHPTHLKVRALHYLSQRAADRIITVSESAKTDIMSAYGVPGQKISVIYGAAGEEFNSGVARSLSELQHRWPEIRPSYLFYVGGLELRKNIPNLLRAIKLGPEPRRQLVIAGGGSQDMEALLKLGRELGIENDLLFLGYIPQEWLPTLYRQAYAFVYPSWAEGFGLQVVEAMKMGVPVVASNQTSLPEVLGDGEALFDPSEPRSIASRLTQLEDKSYYERRKAHVARRASEFSWEKNRIETQALYTEVLRG